ncbi:MAG: penicillin acylase family protein [Salinibacter sp.]
MSSFRARVALLSGLLVLTAGVLYGLQVRIQGLPAASTVLDPVDGLYRTARQATPAADTTRLRLPGLDAPVTILRDRRHVPHIYAESDRDAVIALGYVTARDRLFQLDFIPRVASGRLAEAFGPQAVDTDRFLRRTGMEWGAQKNLKRIRKADGIELKSIRWYGMGVNAYLDRTAPADLPLEFRLLGYRPDRYRPIQALRLLQYMTFDLTYNTDDPAYSRLRARLGTEAYNTLYPRRPSGLFEPIVPPSQQLRASTARGPEPAGTTPRRTAAVESILRRRRAGRQSLRRLVGGRDVPGKGSNNWAVHEARSKTGAPLLAGDMHLSLSLPSIWYEAHLVTPTMNAYGITVPGAPVLVQAFNRHVGWTLTNTGADVIDHLSLRLDSTRTRYRYDGAWRDLRRDVDTIRVNGGAPVLDTLYYSHHGPVHMDEGGRNTAIAERWVAHDTSRTLQALWKMNRADSLAAVTKALRLWDTPMQNILYAGQSGDIAIRSAGALPIRRSGTGRGLLAGSTDAHEWIGRVPFDSLPAARNPAQDYLASANQVPTGPEYPYYLGHDWSDGYRSLRINALLRADTAHSVADFKRYQSDVNVQQQDVFVPFLMPLSGLSPRADTLRRMLRTWNGEATLDRAEPLVMDEFLSLLRRETWDESVFATAPDPEDAQLVHLLRTRPEARWFDVQDTGARENASALLTHVLEATADTMAAHYGWAPQDWRWGDHHRLVVQHLSGSELLRPLWRGPYEYPGFASTLSPGRGRTVTHSASQRVLIDFSTTPPTGYGVYPGGQNGRPLDPYFYDTQLPTYLDFGYFPLRTAASPSALPGRAVRSRRTLVPR